jgi:hypothetical protein
MVPICRPRRAVVSVAALDAASSEVASALTALAAASAMVLGLGSAIRQANGFDSNKLDKPAPVAAAETTVPELPEVSPAVPTSVVPSPGASSSDVEHVRSWIAAWREKSPLQGTGEDAAKGSDSQPANAVTAASEWISSWRNKAPPASEDVATSQANPAAAVAVLDSLSSDTPVGATASNNNKTATMTPTQISSNEEDNESVTVASNASPATPTEDREIEAISQNGGTQRAVTVPDQYQNKIDSLWASYEEKRAKQSELLKRQEKITMDIAALEAVNEKINMQGNKPAKINIVRQVIDFLASVWAFIKSFIAQVMGKLGNRPSGQSA